MVCESSGYDVPLKSSPTLLLHTHLIIPLVSLVVEISVSYTPPPGFTPGPNEYRAASGPVVFTCTAIGGSGSGDYDYEWTSTCSGCVFKRKSTGVTSEILRTAVHSSDKTSNKLLVDYSCIIMYDVIQLHW